MILYFLIFIINETKRIMDEYKKLELDTPQKRLEYYIKQVFHTKTRFAEAMGMIPSDVSKYTAIDGSIFSSSEKYRKLSNLGLNMTWYITGDGEMMIPTTKEDLLPHEEVDDEELQDFLEIEVYDIPANANVGSLVSFYDLPYSTKKLGLSMKLNNKTTKAVRVSGNSMVQDGLEHGGVVVYDFKAFPRPGDIVIAVLNNVVLVKRYSVNEKGFIEFHTSDDRIQTIIVNEIDDKLKILGVVKARINF
ncbi:MAG: S24 family peptidase [Paludibacter sp.]